MKHFILVHGSCHRAWCWYKLVTLLKEADHRVTVIDLGEGGDKSGCQGEIATIDDYVEPLMELMKSVNPKDDHEKVALVGHSFGGIAISLAMEKFPLKISVAVFVSAYMPNCSSPPITLLQETFRRAPLEEWLDTKFVFDNGSDKFATHAVFGTEMLTRKLYQNCSAEDLELAKKLIKADGLFTEDLAKTTLLTKKRYGGVKRVYVMCEEDELVKVDFQKWIIDQSPPHQVKFIPKADHMVMLSKPRELCRCLLEIVA